MDRLISFTVEPSDGTPYQKLVNADSLLPARITGDFQVAGFYGTETNPLAWNVAGELRFGGGAASVDELSAYISNALLSFNSVSGPIQVVEPSPILKITNLTTQS
jgi:hypothetical protein